MFGKTLEAGRANVQEKMSAVITPGESLNTIRNKRYYLETYGCRYNFADSIKLCEILNHQGCSRAATEEEADIVIINTCTVTEKTERRMLRRLTRAERTLYVTGCMAEIQKEAILSVCSPVFIPHHEIQSQYRKSMTVPRENVGIVQIAQGCTGSCTYCITRHARGSLQSTPLREILGQVSAWHEAGSSEIQLTAQDTGAWGRDIGLTLPVLLNAIGEMEGRFRIRVGMMNPATVLGILDELVGAFSADHIFSFLHLPVQSGSDTILRSMGRGYTVADVSEIITAFRRRFPEITIATDMIVGYPGETEDDFRQSLDLVRRMRFAKVNVTRYSRRPKTAAFSVPDLTDGLKKDRSRAMQQLAERISAEIHAGYIGRVLPFVVTEQIRKGSVMARTDAYLGIVIPEELPVGSSGTAKILQGGTYFIRGRRIRPV